MRVGTDFETTEFLDESDFQEDSDSSNYNSDAFYAFVNLKSELVVNNAKGI